MMLLKRLWRRDSDESGQVTAMVVGLITVLLLAAAVAVLAVSTNVSSSRMTDEQEVARTTAAGAAQIFVAALDETSGFPGNAALTPPTTVFPTALKTAPSKWYSIKSSGLTTKACGEKITATCVKFKDRLEQLTNSVGGTAYEINLQITVRTDCLTPGTPPLGCQMSRLEERIAPRLFTNYLEFDNSELLDPPQVLAEGTSYTAWYGTCTTAGVLKYDTAVVTTTHSAICLIPAYIPTDSITGPVATNDKTIYVCGNLTRQPLFGGLPQATGTPPVTEYPVPGTGQSCTGTHPAGASVPASALPSPDAILPTLATSENRLSSGSHIELCGTGSKNYYVKSATCETGQKVTWPQNGVIYVTGTAYVSGSVCQSGITVFATHNVYVDNNLINEGLGTASCETALTVAHERGGSIGLIAGRSVIVEPAHTGTTLVCWTSQGGDCQVIDAAVMALGGMTSNTSKKALPEATSSALGGGFYETGWSKYNCSSSCVIFFDGSITENFRGAFGGYEAQSTGPRLVKGLAAEFEYAPSLASDPPPYFFKPVSGFWAQEGEVYTGALETRS